MSGQHFPSLGSLHPQVREALRLDSATVVAIEAPARTFSEQRDAWLQQMADEQKALADDALRQVVALLSERQIRELFATDRRS